MNNEIFEYSKQLNQVNLNFIVDHIRINVLNYIIETFQDVTCYEDHKHFNYEFHYIKKGHGLVRFDGKEYKLKPGDLYLIAPNTIHYQEKFDDMVEYALRFEVEVLNSPAKNQTIVDESSVIMEQILSSTNEIYHDMYRFEPLFEHSYEEIYKKRPGYYIMAKQDIMQIIIETARIKTPADYEPYELPCRNIEAHRIDLVNQYIYDNIATKITNEGIANHLYISERQLHRIIKKMTGYSTHQYICHIRINSVKKLLINNTYTLDTISMMSGFSSAFHLSTAFKKYTGMTPTKFIEKNADLFQFASDDKPHEIL